MTSTSCAEPAVTLIVFEETEEAYDQYEQSPPYLASTVAGAFKLSTD